MGCILYHSFFSNQMEEGRELEYQSQMVGRPTVSILWSPMSTYDYAKVHKEKIMSDAVLIAYAVMSIQGRIEDEVSSNEAYRLYGRGWIIDRTKRGLLHFNRNGTTKQSTKVYSRFEIEALKRAENEVSEAFEEAQRRMKELNNQLNK